MNPIKAEVKRLCEGRDKAEYSFLSKVIFLLRPAQKDLLKFDELSDGSVIMIKLLFFLGAVKRSDVVFTEMEHEW
jgi:hypothetical protein